MCADIARVRIILWMLAVLFLANGCARTTPCRGPGRPFEFGTDTFAFANETVWNHADGKPVTGNPGGAEKPEKYTRRCFLLSASAVQFWKFARFELSLPPVDEKALTERIYGVRRRPAWYDALPEEQKVIFPGYANLREFSERKGALLRATLGPGWTTYFEPRKYPMPFVPGRSHQARVNEQLSAWLRAGHPMTVWLYNFPHVDINHAVTVFAETNHADGALTRYLVYDPNYTDAPRVLTFDPQKQEFSYGSTFYFGGGTVHVRAFYLGLLH